MRFWLTLCIMIRNSIFIEQLSVNVTPPFAVTFEPACQRSVYQWYRFLLLLISSEHKAVLGLLLQSCHLHCAVFGWFTDIAMVRLYFLISCCVRVIFIYTYSLASAVSLWCACGLWLVFKEYEYLFCWKSLCTVCQS